MMRPKVVNESAREDLSMLRVLRKVASLKGMTRAAKSLGVRPAAVSSRIQTLESRTGQPVLRRSTRRCALTAEGRALLEGYTKLLQEELDATRALLQAEKARTPQSSSPAGWVSQPGARFDVTLRCLEDGQWAATSRPLELIVVSNDPLQTVYKLTREMLEQSSKREETHEGK